MHYCLPEQRAKYLCDDLSLRTVCEWGQSSSMERCARGTRWWALILGRTDEETLIQVVNAISLITRNYNRVFEAVTISLPIDIVLIELVRKEFLVLQ